MFAAAGCDPVIELDTDHSPWLSRTDELVAALNPSIANSNAPFTGHAVTLFDFQLVKVRATVGVKRYMIRASASLQSSVRNAV
jgi:hypothetical protein